VLFKLSAGSGEEWVGGSEIYCSGFYGISAGGVMCAMGPFRAW
jgi:hypothetical protein